MTQILIKATALAMAGWAEGRGVGKKGGGGCKEDGWGSLGDGWGAIQVSAWAAITCSVCISEKMPLMRACWGPARTPPNTKPFSHSDPSSSGVNRPACYIHSIRLQFCHVILVAV